MLDHVSIGVADPSSSKTFYDAILAPLGYSCLSESAGSLGYGGDQVSLWILEVERPVPADMASGLHFCFAAPTRDSVRAFHAQPLPTAAATTARPACAPIMATAISQPSPSIRMVIA